MDNLDNIASFALGLMVCFLFWISFNPKYVVVKNEKNEKNVTI